MRVSVRLKGLWAAALIASVAVGTPTTTFAQNQFVPNSAANASTPVDINVQAKQTMLQARQALARGDVKSAQTLVAAATKLAANYQEIGDSPATIVSLIERQNELVAWHQAKDPQYNKGAAAFLLSQAEALMYYQDFDGAEALIKSARNFSVQFDESTGSPDQLQKLLALAKADAAKTVAQVPVAPTSNKDAATKLLLRAQFAFDKGQFNDAKALVDDAKKLNVPETEFAANEIRPWQLELEIQKKMDGIRFDPAVVRTNLQDAGKIAGVVQANYNPAQDKTSNAAASFKDDFDGKPMKATSIGKIPTTALELYQAGMKARVAGNREQAKDFLSRAIKMKSQLDPSVQQSIQDQLLKLTASGTGNIARASQNLPVNDFSQDDLNTYRALQDEVFRERAAADRLLQKSPREALEKMSMIRSRIGQSSLEAKQQRPLLKMIDRDIDKVQSYIEQNLSNIENLEANKERMNTVNQRRQRRLDVGQQMQKLVEDYNRLNKEQRYAEAEVIARQAFELDPKSEIAVLLIEKSRLNKRVEDMDRIRDKRERSFVDSMTNVEQSATSMNTNQPAYLGDLERFTRNGARRAARIKEGEYDTEAERIIWNKLKNTKVQGDYKGTLAQATQQLSTQAGINIVFDELAINGRVRTDSAVDVPITTPISLQSALEVILSQKGLVFDVSNEVIKVTTKESRQSNMKVKTLYIGDLVMPMRAPQNPMQMQLMNQSPRQLGAMGGSMNVQDSVTSQPRSQLAMAQQMGNMVDNNPLAGATGYGGPQRGQAEFWGQGQNAMGGVSIQDFQQLMNLITTTIQPESWLDSGTGQGTLTPYLNNLSLVVTQTQEVQDEIQDLLTKLRELNDVQIVVEVRFVTLQDNFFERVGIDFDFNINDNSGVTDPTADTQVGGSTVVGQQPIDTTPFTPTGDLDLQFLQGNFSAAEPLFGGFSAASAASFGFAILSDIEVFFLLQASKGNTRTNITQAPTVTMFNGQSANVTDNAQRPFVTSVIPVVGDFAVAHQPIISLLPDGTNLNVTAVVSADRQFVRLQLVPFFSQVTEVSTFTFDGSTRTERSTDSVLDDLLDIVDGGNNADDTNDELATTVQGITVQLPVLATTTVSTVVSVPDGGTVLMGGIKRMREGRNESGVPFLSNLPYINRLFKNVGIGHETQHLMMMVTPRIIIQEEIKEEQVGLTLGE